MNSSVFPSLFPGSLLRPLLVFFLVCFTSLSFAHTGGEMAGLPDMATLAEKAGPAVVNIRAVQTRHRAPSPASDAERQLHEYLFRFFGVPIPHSGAGRGQPAPEVRRGMGSGFLISADGFILTNAHVVDGADDVMVKLMDRREFSARIVGLDKRTDIALLQIEGASLPFLKLGSSADIRVGEWVLAIGSPFMLDNTVTAGIISAKARETGDYLPLIQTDVAVNPGNSGGPLINMRGEVIGINSQIYSRSGGFMGISFAIPIDEATRVAEQLKATGRVSRGRIGIQISEVPADVARALNLPENQGILVNQVDPGGSAARAGMRAGDIILEINREPLRAMNDLPRRIGEAQPGSKAVLSVWRKGAAQNITVTIEAIDEQTADRKGSASPEPDRSELAENALGISVSNLTDRQKSRLQLANGAFITALSQSALMAGLRQGDVVLRVNNTDIQNASQFQTVVAGLDRKKPVVILVQRGDSIMFVSLRFPA